MLFYLRQMYGENAQWKSPEQYHGVRALLDLKRDILLAMPTGAGKTLVAVLPSLVEKAYTVIVLPLIALMEDWERRLKKLGIGYERFQGAANPTLHGRENVILVSSDMVKGKHWSQAISMLAAQKPVARYVFDEAQYYFTDADFRKTALGNPFTIRKFPAQVALMTATCSEPAQRYLEAEFGLTNLLRISGVSDRPELSLRIYQKDESDMLHKLQSLVEECVVKNGRWGRDDRYLVFVTQHVDGEAVAKALGIPFYHANSANHPITDEERQQMYRAWIAGDYPGMVTTSALGAGNDYAHVRFTVHVRAPHEAVSAVQMWGRAGRDGHRAYNFVIAALTPRRMDEKRLHPVYGDMCGMRYMRNLTHPPPDHVYPHTCHVYQQTSFFDGEGYTCRALGRKELCSSCKSGCPSTPLIQLLMRFVEMQPPPPPEPLYVHPTIDPTQALLWTGEKTAAGTKRKLQDAFQDVAEQSVARTGRLHNDRTDNLEVFRQLFRLAGDRCGFCVATGHVGRSDGFHNPYNCPLMDSVQRATYSSLKGGLRYNTQPGHGVTCFKCHIAPLGDDALHPPFAKRGDPATCQYPHLVPALATAVFHVQPLRDRAEAHFSPGMGWSTVAGYSQWLTAEHRLYKTQVMALLKWASDYLIQ